MNQHLITYAEHIERQAESIRQDSQWADGGAYAQDLADVSLLMGRAQSLRNRAAITTPAPTPRQTSEEYRAWLDARLAPAIATIHANKRKAA